MRKLFNFYKICYCYFLMFVFAVLFGFFNCIGILAFWFINLEKFSDITNDFSNKLSKIIENKISEIKKKEFDILNVNTPLGARCKNVNWWKEVFITLIIGGGVFTVIWYIS